MDKNMELWNSVCETPKEKTKLVSYGARKFTSVCAQYQIKTATKQWGAFGSKWGVKEESYNAMNDNVILYKAILFYPEGQVEIHTDIELNVSTKNGVKYNDDWAKKAATDALTKGLSWLGFNSDIFEGVFDNKYNGQNNGSSGNNQNSGNDDNKEWLDEKMPEFNQAKAAIASGIRTIVDVRKKFKVSKKIAELLTQK